MFGERKIMRARTFASNDQQNVAVLDHARRGLRWLRRAKKHGIDKPPRHIQNKLDTLNKLKVKTRDDLVNKITHDMLAHRDAVANNKEVNDNDNA